MKKDALAQIAQERPGGWRVSLLKRSSGLPSPLRAFSEMLATQRNDPRRKVICFLQILLLVTLNH